MTTGQIAIIVPAATAVILALANISFQLRLTRQTLKHQRELAVDTFDHQRKLAVQDRVSSTYEDMLDLVGHTMETVTATKPIAVMGQPPEPPDELDKALIRRVQARIGVHGSPDVKAILERWSMATNGFYLEAWKLNEMQGAEQRSVKPSEIKENWGLFTTEQWQVVEAKRKELHGIVRELEDAVPSLPTRTETLTTF